MDIAGLGVWLQAPDAPRAAAIAHLLAGADAHHGPADITVSWRDAPFAVPDRPSEHPYPGLGIWHDAASDAVTLQHGALTARADRQRIDIGGRVAGPNPPWLDFRRVFEAGIASVLAWHGRYMLHGGAIARGGRAFLVLGSTGSGKSTLGWAAQRGGWQLLADDQLIVRDGRAGYEVCGMRKPVAVPGELIEEAPEGARRLENTGRARWELPASVPAGGWHAVRGVLRPAHADSDSGELVPLAPMELLPGLVGAFVASGHPPLLRRWLPHAAALSRLGGWELRHARPAHRRLAAAARWLDVAFEQA